MDTAGRGTAGRGFNRRAFVSAGMLASGLVLPFSGLACRKLQHETLTVAKQAWMSVHSSAGILFCVFAVWHVKLNWRALVRQCVSITTSRDAHVRREAVAGILLVIVVVGAVTSHVLLLPG